MSLGLRSIVCESWFTRHGLRSIVYESWFTEANVNHVDWLSEMFELRGVWMPHVSNPSLKRFVSKLGPGSLGGGGGLGFFRRQVRTKFVSAATAKHR